MCLSWREVLFVLLKLHSFSAPSSNRPRISGSNLFVLSTSRRATVRRGALVVISISASSQTTPHHYYSCADSGRFNAHWRLPKRLPDSKGRIAFVP